VATQIEIVPKIESDLERLYGLAKDTFGDFPDWRDEQVLDVLRRDIVFVARAGEKQAGYIALRPDPAAATVFVEQLLVAPAYERQGVGHRLLAYAEGYAISASAQTLRIVAEKSNWRARRFYRSSGFVPVGAELLELVLPRSG
jgi:ribosomal protein S18 acetylase RimI-like enzyme